MPCSSMYQMLKLKLGPQDIRGTETHKEKTQSEDSGNTEMLDVARTLHQPGSVLTYFDKSAGKHLLVYLVL